MAEQDLGGSATRRANQAANAAEATPKPRRPPAKRSEVVELERAYALPDAPVSGG